MKPTETNRNLSADFSGAWISPRSTKSLQNLNTYTPVKWRFWHGNYLFK